MTNAKRQLQNRICYVVIITICMIAAFFSLSVSAAEGSLELQAEPALSGQLKSKEPFPVKFTLTNHGDAIEGFLSVRYASDSSRDSIVSQKVEIAQGSSQEIWLVLPGRTYTKGNNEIVFTTGSSVNGKAVPFSNGKQSIEITPVHPQTFQIGVLSSDPNAYNFLNLLGQNNYEIKVHALHADDLFSELLLQLDAVAINNYTGEPFSTEQLDALNQWIQQGGRLILSGGASYSKLHASLMEWSPVDVFGVETVQTLKALELETGQPLAAASGITIATGQLRSGQVLLSEGDDPIFASTKLGRGDVWFVAYDVTLEPLAAWSGNSQLWERMLQDMLTPVNPRGGLIHRGDDYWEMDRALDFFPKLAAPSLGMMALLFFLYVLIAAPLLYFILKKADKRGWAWFIIPSMALLCSLSIYVVGAWDRNDTLAQHLDIVELYGDGNGHRTTAAAYFVPKGGDYTLTYGQNKRLNSFIEKFSTNNVYELGGKVEAASMDGSLTFYDVPFWSIRKLWMEDRTIETYGDLAFEVSFNGTELIGHITNETGEPLEHVHVIYQHAYQEIGSLADGETKSIQLNLHQASGSHLRNIGYDLFPHQGSQDVNQHKRALLNLAFEEGQVSTVTAFGFSTSEQAVVIDGENVQADVYALWLKRAEFNYVYEGKISIPFGEIKPLVTSIDDRGSGASYYFEQNRLEMSDGELELELTYPLPLIEQAKYDKLSVRYQIPSPEVVLQIWNESAQAWEMLDHAGTLVTYSNPDDYMNQERIRLKVTQTQGYYGIQLPELMLEGSAGHD